MMPETDTLPHPAPDGTPPLLLFDQLCDALEESITLGCASRPYRALWWATLRQARQWQAEREAQRILANEQMAVVMARIAEKAKAWAAEDWDATPDPPTDAPGDDCPDHGPYADEECPKCDDE